MKKFIEDFANQFDDTDLSEFSAATKFHEMDEWGSLLALAILNMIAKKYNVKVSMSELRDAVTIEDVYKLVVSKQ